MDAWHSYTCIKEKGFERILPRNVWVENAGLLKMGRQVDIHLVAATLAPFRSKASSPRHKRQPQEEVDTL